jgi:hypothetical protein
LLKSGGDFSSSSRGGRDDEVNLDDEQGDDASPTLPSLVAKAATVSLAHDGVIALFVLKVNLEGRGGERRGGEGGDEVTASL